MTAAADGQIYLPRTTRVLSDRKFTCAQLKGKNSVYNILDCHLGTHLLSNLEITSNEMHILVNFQLTWRPGESR